MSSEDAIIRPGSKADTRPRREPDVYLVPGRPDRRQEYEGDYVTALATLIGWAHADGIEIAGWVSEGLRKAGGEAGGMAKLLARRPGSWEAHCVGQLGIEPEVDDPSILG